MVLEIKDKSELMIDLAYSSILYDNKIIAEEVYDLENYVDDLYQNIRKKCLENVKNGHLSVDDALTLMKLSALYLESIYINKKVFILLPLART